MCLERATCLYPSTWMLGKSEYVHVPSNALVSFEGFQLGFEVLVRCYTDTLYDFYD